MFRQVQKHQRHSYQQPQKCFTGLLTLLTQHFLTSMEQEASVPPPDAIEPVFHNPATANVFHHAVLYISGISVPVVVPSGHFGVSVLNSRLVFTNTPQPQD